MHRHRSCLFALVLIAFGPVAAPAQTLPLPQTLPAIPPAGMSANQVAPPVDLGIPAGVPMAPVETVQMGAPLPMEAMPGPLISGPVGYSGSPVWTQPCSACGMSEQCWFGADYLFWFIPGNPTPPLVTRSPASTPQSQAGVLGVKGTRIDYGGERFDGGLQSGFRVRGGTWLDDCHLYGIEGSFFYLGPNGSDYSSGQSNGAVLARPFVNLSTKQQDAWLVNYPGVVQGQVTGSSQTSVLGGNATMIYELFCCDPGQAPADPCNSGCKPSRPAGYQRLDFLFGYRYFQLSDQLSINQQLSVLDGTALGTFPTGANVLQQDYFYTRNDYHTVDLGLNYTWRRERFYLNVRPVLGLGWLKAVGSVRGFTTIAEAGQATRRVSGGLLAQPTNGGTFHNQQFAWMPQLELTAGYQITSHLLVHVGWSGQYFGKVLRAGDQIDRTLNTTQFAGGTLVGDRRPHYPRDFTDLWVTGFNVGGELRY